MFYDYGVWRIQETPTIDDDVNFRAMAWTSVIDVSYGEGGREEGREEGRKGGRKGESFSMTSGVVERIRDTDGCDDEVSFIAMAWSGKDIDVGWEGRKGGREEGRNGRKEGTGGGRRHICVFKAPYSGRQQLAY